jgi:NAD+ kinase
MAIPFQKTIRTAGLIGKYESPEVAESLPQLAAFLAGRGVRVLVEETMAGEMKVSHGETASYEAMGRQADVAIVLGGDGTMLYVARRLAEFGVPLAGVNLGRLGFMSDIARHDMLAGVADLLDGRFSAESRVLLQGEIWRAGECIFRNQAFNEVVVNKGDLGRMIEMKVEVDGEFLYVLRADGIIVSTPTGSTAYALSANGPILHPSLAGIALVPLCPHALSNRPITIGDGCEIEIMLLPPNAGRVHVDGQARCDAVTGDRIRIARSPHVVTLLHPPGYNYYTMLREKLHWSEPPKH